MHLKFCYLKLHRTAGPEEIVRAAASMQQSESIDDRDAAQLAAYALAANKVSCQSLSLLL